MTKTEVTSRELAKLLGLRPGKKRTLTYGALQIETRLLAAILRNFVVEKGDRVVLYMPMVPEAAIAMLACARLCLYCGEGQLSCFVLGMKRVRLSASGELLVRPRAGVVGGSVWQAVVCGCVYLRLRHGQSHRITLSMRQGF